MIKHGFTMTVVVFLAVVAFGAFNSVAAETWGRTIDGLCLAVSTETNSYEVGRQILLSVRLRNDGNKDLSVYEGWDPYRIFQFKVLNVGGEEIAASSYVIRVRGDMPMALSPDTTEIGLPTRTGYMGKQRILKSKDVFAFTVQLTLICDLSLPGNYTVTVSMPSPSFLTASKKEDIRMVISNQLVLTLRDLALADKKGRIISAVADQVPQKIENSNSLGAEEQDQSH